MAQVEKVGVLGAGLMGHGIAQVAAQAGYDVVLREVDEARLAKGIGQIEKQLARAVEKGRAEQSEADAVRGQLLGRPARDALAAQKDFAAVRRQHARDQVEHRRLAGAVGSHDRHDLARRNLEAHAVDRDQPTEALG